MATTVDAAAPFVDHREVMAERDTPPSLYRLEPLQDFRPEVSRRVRDKGLVRTHAVRQGQDALSALSGATTLP